MAVAVYITNERDATEVAVDNKATKEVCIVGRSFKGAVGIKIVSATVRNAQRVKIVPISKVVNGEVL